jgi:hypothetical protein
MTQTSYAEQARATAGMLADLRAMNGAGLKAAIADGGLKPGTIAFWSDQSTDLVSDPPAFESAVADVDGLVASSVATAVTAVVISGTALDGAVGPGPLQYGYRVTIALSSHADFNNSHITIRGRDAMTGEVVSEVLYVPDAGNVTLTSGRAYDRVDSLTLDAQGGTGGGVTAGYTAPVCVSRAAIAGIVVRQAAHEPVSDEMQFEDGDTLTVLRKGPIFCEIDQDLTAGGDLFMRVTASTAELAGSLRADADTADAVLLPLGFSCLEDADESAFALAKIEVSL